MADLTILLARDPPVVGVNALKSSLGYFNCDDHSIAMLLGRYLRFRRPGRRAGSSVMGVCGHGAFVVVAGAVGFADYPSWLVSSR